MRKDLQLNKSQFEAGGKYCKVVRSSLVTSGESDLHEPEKPKPTKMKIKPC